MSLVLEAIGLLIVLGLILLGLVALIKKFDNEETK